MNSLQDILIVYIKIYQNKEYNIFKIIDFFVILLLYTK